MLGLMTSAKRLLGSTLGLSLLLSGQAWAQTLPDGPLSAPDATPPAKASGAAPASAKTASAKPRKVKKAHAAAAPIDSLADEPPHAHPGKAPVAKPVKDAPADPLSLGMKWNGSNDNAEQTRTQNYSGSAPGTGASVGLIYHF